MTNQSGANGARELLVVLACGLFMAIASVSVSRAVATAVAQARGIPEDEIGAMVSYLCYPVSALLGGAGGVLLAVIGERRWLVIRYAALLGVIALAAALLGFLLGR